MISMTEKQSQLLVFLKQRIAEDNGVCPSFDEMKDAVDLKSKSGVARLITALEERGLIRRLPNRARAIEIVPQSPPERLAEFSTPQLVAELARRSAGARATQSAGASC